jgi:hypothetical protein
MTLRMRHALGDIGCRFVRGAKRLRRPSDTDQVTLGICEVADRETRALVHLGAHRPLAAQALGLLERSFHVGDTDVENRVAAVARTSPNPTRDPRSSRPSTCV